MSSDERATSDKSSRVLILGASARAAAESATRAGWSVVASDMFGDIDLRRISEFVPIDNYPIDFKRVIEAFDLPTIYTGGLENYSDLLDPIRTLWGNRSEQLTKSRDPFWWTPRLHELGINIATVYRHDSPTPNGKPVLKKPLHSAGGNGVELVPQNQSVGSDHYLQEFIQGDVLSAVFIGSRGDCRLCGVTQQVIWPGLTGTDFAYGGSVGPVELSRNALDQLELIGSFLNSEAGLRGIFGVDFVLRSDDSVTPIEINPRYTASVEVLEIGFSQSLLLPHHAAFKGEAYPMSNRQEPQFVAKIILYASDRTVIDHNLDQQDMPVGVRLADIPSAGSVIDANHPICTVVAPAGSLNEACDKARQVADLVPFASFGSESLSATAERSA
ncbi:MAG: ATP-grasp domain-containing protein [Planctomycetaceae bacterium]